jgi:hypothetical protein
MYYHALLFFFSFLCVCFFLVSFFFFWWYWGLSSTARLLGRCSYHQLFFVMVFFEIGSCELFVQAGFEL